MPGPNVHPDAHMDSAIPVHPAGPAIDSGQPGRLVRTPLLVASTSPRGCSSRELVPVAGPGISGYDPDSPGPGGRLYVRDAEDDHHADGRPAPEVHEPDDALDDAPHVRIFHDNVPKRTGPVLGHFQRRRRGNSRIRNRLGAPGVPQSHATLVEALRGSGPCAPGGGDSSR